MAPKFNHICVERSNRPVTSKIQRVQKVAYSIQSLGAKCPADVMAIIHEIQNNGVKSLWTIADALNARGIRGARGGKWYATTVRKFLEQNRANRPAE
jgi:Recombinase